MCWLLIQGDVTICPSCDQAHMNRLVNVIVSTANKKGPQLDVPQARPSPSRISRNITLRIQPDHINQQCDLKPGSLIVVWYMRLCYPRCWTINPLWKIPIASEYTGTTEGFEGCSHGDTYHVKNHLVKHWPTHFLGAEWAEIHRDVIADKIATRESLSFVDLWHICWW